MNPIVYPASFTRRSLAPLLLVALGMLRAVGQEPIGRPEGEVAGVFGDEVGGGRRQIVVGLPAGRADSSGRLIVEPNVNVKTAPPGAAVFDAPAVRPSVYAGDLDLDQSFARFMQSAAAPEAGAGAGEELLPTPLPSVDGRPEPVFDDILGESLQKDRRHWLAALLGGSGGREAGVGRERLPHAPFEIDTAQPLPSWRMRVLAVGNQQFPDRAEHLWAQSVVGRGPKAPERSLDYQEYRLQMELGNKKFSTATEIPIRWTNPELNPNHTGLGDLRLTVKTVLLDGETWQITQLFRTYMATGSPSMGLGTGHFSIEPGFLGRYRWSDTTMLHGQIKYLVPLGGHPTFSGQVLEYGVGMSRVWWESDTTAILPTLELVGSSVLNGQQTAPTGVVEGADGQHFFSLTPGVRIARDRGSELGLFEFGVSSAIPLTAPRFYDHLLRLDFRWSY